MSNNNILIWNACGLNNRERRSVVRNLVAQERISVVCLQETKVASVSGTFQSESLPPAALLRRIIDKANAWMGAGFQAMSIFMARAD